MYCNYYRCASGEIFVSIWGRLYLVYEYYFKIRGYISEWLKWIAVGEFLRTLVNES